MFCAKTQSCQKAQNPERLRAYRSWLVPVFRVLIRVSGLVYLGNFPKYPRCIELYSLTCCHSPYPHPQPHHSAFQTMPSSLILVSGLVYLCTVHFFLSLMAADFGNVDASDFLYDVGMTLSQQGQEIDEEEHSDILVWLEGELRKMLEP